MFDLVGLLKAVVSVVVPQSLYRYAKNVISRGITRVANAISNFLYERGFYRSARTVRHIARFLVNLGPQLITFFSDVYGYFNDYADVDEEVDEVEIDGYRYTLGGQRYVYY
jgi:hypothetical protein